MHNNFGQKMTEARLIYYCWANTKQNGRVRGNLLVIELPHSLLNYGAGFI